MAVEENVVIRLQTVLDTKDVKSGVNEIQNALKGIKFGDSDGAKKLENDLTTLATKYKDYKKMMEQPVKTKADAKAVKEAGKEIKRLTTEIKSNLETLSESEIRIEVDDSNLEQLTEQLNVLKRQYQETYKEIAKKNWGREFNSVNKIGITGSKEFKSGGDPFEVLKSLSGGSSKELKGYFNSFSQALNTGEIDKAKESLTSLFDKMQKLTGTEKRWNKIFGEGTFSTEKLTQFQTAFVALLDKIGIEGDEAAAGIKEIQQNIDNIDSQELDAGAQAMETLKQVCSALGIELDDVVDGFNKTADSSVHAADEVEQLTKRVQYFFGLQNQIQLFKRVIREAFETVQELDKTMTETAVVTDFSVGDMWQQLPEYTAEAKALGATINDLYKANTLYYQQGLNSAQAMQLGTETLKMARIAGMDAADATDAMTAALRGFNMELNETSAQRVNDVYSALAAKTASDTKEISTAVEKTASLAYSAGMNVEQTSAFLAQIIETTREAPETAGTALKTIIARFGEVKKLSEEGLTTGTDEEGQEIDINKVDKALKTAGISLQEFIQGNESLGDVFLKLSERWSTLSLEQQRYIATMAAGARQQSRFIAMMQNTARTQELLNIAYNAEGASQEQFEKTLEGLESIMNQLKDEWQQFIMGIANSDLIKGFFKVLTDGLKLVNNIIDSISGAVGGVESTLGNITKSILSLGAFIGGLNISGKFITGGTRLLAGSLSKKGGLAGEIGKKLVNSLGKTGPLVNGVKRFFEIASKDGISEGIKKGFNKAKKEVGKKGAAIKDFGEEFSKKLASPIGIGMTIALGSVLAGAAVKMGYETNIKEQIKAGEEVKHTFDEVNEAASKNLAYLESNGKRYSELSKKIGDYNANLGLSEADYKEFLEINNKIAEISPSLVQGYDDQGNAILNVSSALQEATKEQKKYLENAKEIYTQAYSTQGIARAASLRMGAREYKKSTGQKNWYDQEGGIEEYTLEFTLPDNINFKNKELKKLYKKLPDLLKKRYGELIPFDDLEKATGSELEKLVRDSEDILSEVFADESLTEKAKLNFKTAWDKYIKYIQTDLLDSGAELKDHFMDLLSFNDLDLQSLDFPQELASVYSDLVSDAVYEAQLNPYNSDFIYKKLEKTIKKMGPMVSNYKKILENATPVQEKFLKQMSTDLVGATEEYKHSIQPVINSLTDMKRGLDLSEESGRAVNRMLDEQIALLTNYPTDFTTGITNEYNTMAKAIENANNSLEEYKKKTEGGDYYTLADEYASIFKSMDEDKNKSGLGSITYWAGGQTLFDKKVLKKGKEAVDSMMEDWRGAFEEGKEGYDNFINQLYKNKDKIKDFVTFTKDNRIEFTLDFEENLDAFAKRLGLTTDLLSAFINKSRQWLALDFTASDTSMYSAYAGMESGVTKGQLHDGKQRLYINRKTRNALLDAQNYDEETKKDIKKRQKSNQIFAVDEEYFTDTRKNKKGVENGTRRLNKYIKEIEATTAEEVIKGLQNTEFEFDDILKTLTGRTDLSIDELNNLTEEQVTELIDKIAKEEEDPLMAEEVDAVHNIEDGVQTLVESRLGITSETKDATNGVVDLIAKLKQGELGSLANVNERLNIIKQQKQKWEEELNNNKPGSEDYEIARHNIDYLNGYEAMLESALENYANTIKEKEAELSKTDPYRNGNPEPALTPKQQWKEIAGGTKEERGDFQENLQFQFDSFGEESVRLTLERLGFTKEGSDWVIEYKLKQKEEANNTKKSADNGDMFTGLDRDGKPVDIKAALEVEDGAAAKAVEEDTEKNPPKIVAHVEPDPSGGPNVQNRGEKLSRTIANGDMATGKNEQNFEIIPDTTKAVQAIDELGEQFNMSASDGVSSGIVAGSEAGKKRAEQILDNIKGIAHIRVSVDNPTLTVSGTNGKSFTFTVTAHSQGRNLNTIPNYASYAKGRIKGGKETALTGETGYEVAWFPSEGKSTILGLNGPEMVDLPKDAVVFPHKQSKKILKGNPNRPDLGSHDSDLRIRGGGYVGDIISGSSGGAQLKKDSHRTAQATEKIAKGTDKNLAKWANLDLQLKQISTRLDLNQNKIKDYLSRSDASKKGLESKSYYQDYLDDLKAQEIGQAALLNRYQKQLNKAAKKKTGNKTEINYGKGKKGKEKVELNKYITKNASGDFIIDENALKKVSKKNKKRGQAIRDAAQKYLDDLIGKRDSAEKAQYEASKKTEELAKLIDDTFYNWEMELKRIHEIQMQINTLQQREGRYQSTYELEKARAEAGYGDAGTAEAMTKAMRREGEALSQRISLSIAAVDESKKNLDALFNIKAIKSTQQQDIAKEALKYVTYRKRADGSYDYDINTGALEARYNNGQLTKEEYDKIKEYLDKIVNGVDDLESKMKDAYDAYKASFDKLTDIRQQLADYEQKVFEGLKAQLEEEINNQEKISASITDELKKLYDEVKKAIDMRRRAEDNTKTEEDIQKKQQRLAMLRADTSGGNALEIAQLEQEIGDAQQNYQRTLEDQLIQDLQDQADEAAAQREEQITLQRQILETDGKLKELMDLASKYVSDPDLYTEEIRGALGTQHNEIIGYWGSLVKKDQAEAAIPDIQALLSAESLTANYVDALEKSNTMDKLRSWLEGGGNINAAGGKTGGGDNPKGGDKKKETIADTYQKFKDASKKGGKKDLTTLGSMLKKSSKIGKSQKTIAKELADTDLYSWVDVIRAAAKAGIPKKEIAKWWDKKSQKFRLAYEDVFNENLFATGGLNTTTGPAWLDGTKSKPELVLNATDTKNFLQLKDVLSHVMKGAAALPDTSAGESNTYEININVDHLNNDYDVDKVAERVKKIIVKDSSYRNVTAVRKFR